jgi:hypothetical protein
MKQFLSVNNNGTKGGDSMKRSIVRIGLGVVMGGLLWGGLPANQAVAAFYPVTFNFTGTVNQNLGTVPLSGSFTFNPDPAVNPDSNPSPDTGKYNNAITALSVHVGTFFTGVLGTPSPGNNFIKIVNTPSLDAFNVRAPLSGNPGEHNFFTIKLKDTSGTVFSNDHLPTTAPSLSSFTKDSYRVVFEDANGKVKISGSLLTLTSVPLPTSVILFGAGLIALVGLGAGSWRQRNNISTSLA